jgi:hypothetical protein
VSSARQRLRHLLPWTISVPALIYVFGFATDWSTLYARTRQANLPLFFVVTVIDKGLFFLAWALIQGESINRFVTPVPRRTVIALRGGAELVGAVNHGFGNAAFILGLTQLTPGRLGSVIAATGVPFLSHGFVLLLQASLVLGFLQGGIAANRGVAVAVAIGWTAVAVGVSLVRFGPSLRFVANSSLGERLSGVRFRRILPFLGFFALLTCADIVLQRLTSSSFGIHIPWLALAARIPLLYTALSLPSLGNFGTRELAWVACFSDFASRDQLIAYAFVTNTTFLILNVLLGATFLPRALELITEVRRARAAGKDLPERLLTDPSDP